MVMIATIYTKQNCPYCVYAKQLMEEKNITYNEVIIGEDMTRERFIEEYPHVKTLPLIFMNGNYVGGYDDLQKWMNKNAS